MISVLIHLPSCGTATMTAKNDSCKALQPSATLLSATDLCPSYLSHEEGFPGTPISTQVKQTFWKITVYLSGFGGFWCFISTETTSLIQAFYRLHLTKLTISCLVLSYCQGDFFYAQMQMLAPVLCSVTGLCLSTWLKK